MSGKETDKDRAEVMTGQGNRQRQKRGDVRQGNRQRQKSGDVRARKQTKTEER